MEELCRELENEYHTLDLVLEKLDQKGWNLVTPFDNWTIGEEIGHLAYYDNKAIFAVTDPGSFKSHLKELMATCKDADQMFELSIKEARNLEPDKLMELWRKERSSMVQALKSLAPGAICPWYGPPMTATSFAAARLMETWAHGQDILDTLGIKRTPTPALRHIALLGVKTFGWSYLNRNLPKPVEKVHVELTAPLEEIWSFGDKSLENRVKGTALDFCLVVTQRRHVNDTALYVEGATAKKWMTIAQAFAGPPTTGQRNI